MSMFSFLRRAPAPVATPESYEAAQVSWLLGTLASALRLAPSNLVPADPHDMAAVLQALDRRGLTAEPLTLKDWLDEAKTPRDAKVLVLGGGMSLLLGHQEGNVVLASPGDSTPQVQSTEALAERLSRAQMYWVKTKENMEESYGWRWFLSSFFSRKAVIRDALIASLVIQLVGLAYPLATQAIVDKVITNQAQSTLIALGIGIALFAVFNALMSWLRQKLLLRLANVVDVDLSNKVLAHLFRLPLRYFEARPTGLLITRTQGVERVRECASGAFLLVALELPFMLIFLGLMLSYSLELSGVVLGFVTVMVGLSFACGPHLRNLANKQFEAGAKVQGFLTERVAAHETVKSLQLEVDTVGRFSDLNRKKLDTALDMREFGNGYITFMQLGEQLMGASVLCLGAYLAMTGPGLTIGMLVAFQMFAQRVSQPLLKVAGTWQELQQVRTAVSQLGDVMSTSTEQYSLVATSAGPVKGSLAVQGLGFRHSPDRPPLYQDLNFDVKPGQVALVTGPSGCGKSTLAKVMQGLYRGHDGFVRLDGRDTRSMPVNELRSRFGVVPQETVLFSGTLLDNLVAGGNASMDHVVQACRMAGIHEAIENMAQGYQTEVGERGTGLSGGQRQRIGIARALLKRPSVLIFDEATSGLDDASAEHIGQTVNFLRGKVTVMFVAHKVPRCLQVDTHIQLAGPGPKAERAAA